MRIRYSTYEVEKLEANAVRNVVCIAKDSKIEGYGTPADARAFAAELIAAATKAEAYVLTEADRRDESEFKPCSICGGPVGYASPFSWCLGCDDDARLDDRD